jgi:hypothetical protein
MIEFTQDELDRIVAALIAMQDSDNELGHPDEAQKSLDLINKIRSSHSRT